MNWAALASTLVQLLAHAPEYAAAVEGFWNAIYTQPQHTAAIAGHHDEVMAAIAEAKERTPAG